MIVKRIPGADKYLVIEGNRRTTAIKHILEASTNITPVVRSTLTSLHAKEFFYKPNREILRIGRDRHLVRHNSHHGTLGMGGH